MSKVIEFKTPEQQQNEQASLDGILTAVSVMEDKYVILTDMIEKYYKLHFGDPSIEMHIGELNAIIYNIGLINSFLASVQQDVTTRLNFELMVGNKNNEENN